MKKVLLRWLGDNIFEEILEWEMNIYGNYFPDRTLIKENSKTDIRPVFDVSKIIQNHPSLNQCLHCTQNPIEFIIYILL